MHQLIKIQDYNYIINYYIKFINKNMYQPTYFQCEITI